MRGLSIAFLVLVGAATAEASQITGTLLVFVLMVIPAATAQTLTARPAASLTLAVALALAATWAGLIAAYYSPYPLGFFVTSFAFAGHVLARGATWGAALGTRALRAASPDRPVKEGAS
ncbi:hypothetical protein GCM10010218_06130 [Streptomyces mashuensis]|uniref:Uncharacterized protein n=1 Tax=Streptomyces mashuensis TaxID=33904 RepID=A0A919AVZ1_9ACTN|nr:metal ABC transporter permease [Streptomyces mashuensis]GHF27842.1 hypothetical protein GCM10010218_06130 [Streptomyces mashuensis]